jgi:hypothetical protein
LLPFIDNQFAMAGLSVEIGNLPTIGSRGPPSVATIQSSRDRKSFAGHARLKLILPVAFLAAKYAAFPDRGEGDCHASHDLEDFVTVIDGRDDIVPAIAAAPESLRAYGTEAVRALLAGPGFNKALPGHLPGDEASQRRLPALRRKLQGIAG